MKVVTAALTAAMTKVLHLRYSALLPGVRAVKSVDALEAGRLGDGRDVALGLYVAEAHGWIRETSDKEYRLTVPGEDIGMYEYWLQNLKEPVRDTAVYQRMRDQLVAATR